MIDGRIFLLAKTRWMLSEMYHFVIAVLSFFPNHKETLQIQGCSRETGQCGGSFLLVFVSHKTFDSITKKTDIRYLLSMRVDFVLDNSKLSLGLE